MSLFSRFKVNLRNLHSIPFWAWIPYSQISAFLFIFSLALQFFLLLFFLLSSSLLGLDCSDLICYLWFSFSYYCCHCLLKIHCLEKANLLHKGKCARFFQLADYVRYLTFYRCWRTTYQVFLGSCREEQ